MVSYRIALVMSSGGIHIGCGDTSKPMPHPHEAFISLTY
jgi:hypothetical protein